MDPSPPIPFLYASRDGHMRRLAEHMAQTMRENEQWVDLIDLEKTVPYIPELKESPWIIIAAPIRFGRHLPAFENFVRANKGWLKDHHVVMISMNLTARKPEKATPETNPYLRKWNKKNQLCPEIQAVFAGKLHYALYRPWERFMIRLIMKITKGPTNSSAEIDFTPWERVEALAMEIVSRVRGAKKETRKESA